MSAEMDIIDECAVAICKFFKRDPNETIYVRVGGTGALTVQRPLWQLVRGRIFEAVKEISKLEAIKPQRSQVEIKLCLLSLKIPARSTLA